MNVTEIKTQMHMQEWAKLIDARQDSGLTIKQWCQQNNVSETQYYYYLKKLRLATCEALPGKQQEETQFALVPKQARSNSSLIAGASNIRITLSNEVVEIGDGANEAQVKSTLEVLLNAQ
ncbi:MAG: hypothetical protein PHE79_10215 [Eubacteriales bacterium]|nr:hypothetical protein [Eubacteriales bacterium]